MIKNVRSTPQSVGSDIVVRVPEMVYTHELIQVNVPTEGHLTFIFSSAPTAFIGAYKRVSHCPMCRKINPLRASGFSSINFFAEGFPPAGEAIP